MRILYVCDRLITFILNEIIQLKAKGHDVYILSEHSKIIFDVISRPILTENGLEHKIYLFRSFKNRREKYLCFMKNLVSDFFTKPVYALRGLVCILTKFPSPKFGVISYIDARDLFSLELDIIHAPFSTPRVVDKAYLLSKVLNIPFTLCFRAHDIYEDDNFHEVQKRMNMVKEASQLITISNFNKNHIKTTVNGNKDIAIIHSAIDPDLFTPANKSRPHTSITTVSRLTDEKGVIYLLQACHILHQRNIAYDCSIIGGDGPERIKCDKLIDELQIPNINFTGYLPYDEIKERLDRSTVFVLPSVINARGLGDVLANSLKEAMAMKVPVITSDIRGIEELVDDGINGLIVPPKDPEAIADAIEKLFSQPDFREKMGVEGKKKIEKDFNTKIETQKLEDIFKDAVESGF